MLYKYVLLGIVILMSLTSCVSKKKFLEMQDGRLKAEALAQKLDEENTAKAVRIKALIEDFEAMKNELLESNAIKDHYIDSLSSEINVLSENLDKQKESLQETNFNLDFEKQRLTNAINSKDKTIEALQSEVDQLESSVAAKNEVIEQKNFDLQEAKNQESLFKSQIQKRDTDLAGLQSQLEKLKNETENLRSQIKEKDATITKLTNNVKLLKQQLGN